MSLIYFWVNFFMQCERDEISFFNIYLSSFSGTIYWRAVLSPMYVLGTSVENQIAEAIKIYFWVIYSIPMINAFILH